MNDEMKFTEEELESMADKFLEEANANDIASQQETELPKPRKRSSKKKDAAPAEPTKTPEQLLQLTDKFKGSIFTCIVLTIYCLLAFRLIPNKTINTTEDSNGKKSNGPAKKYTSAQETLIYCLFGIVMISLFLAKKLGDIMYVLPGISLLIL